MKPARLTLNHISLKKKMFPEDKNYSDLLTQRKLFTECFLYIYKQFVICIQSENLIDGNLSSSSVYYTCSLDVVTIPEKGIPRVNYSYLAVCLDLVLIYASSDIPIYKISFTKLTRICSYC